MISTHTGELRRYRIFAEKLAVEGGDILKKGFHRRKQVTYKGRINPVTEFDLKSERHIIGGISRMYPSHSILAEEGTDKESRSSYQWVIDPLDGTVNYSHGFPIYCVSIGLLYDGVPVIGVVYDPEAEEMFSAASGLGVSLNGRSIHVSAQSKLQRALLATGFAYDIRTARVNNLGMFARMAKEAEGVRRLGSAALDLCWLAAGRLDGFWEYNLHPWDTAAAVVIVKEAGGKVTRIDGGTYSIFDKQILASNRHIHTAMKAVLNKSKKK